ncbi:MAG: hypothetical protein GY941_22210 [Planctomycetes bacterium]|nr:hypothetical protein [Planctomycetota bacterium]
MEWEIYEGCDLIATGDTVKAIATDFLTCSGIDKTLKQVVTSINNTARKGSITTLFKKYTLSRVSNSENDSFDNHSFINELNDFFSYLVEANYKWSTSGMKESFDEIETYLGSKRVTLGWIQRAKNLVKHLHERGENLEYHLDEKEFDVFFPLTIRKPTVVGKYITCSVTSPFTRSHKKIKIKNTSGYSFETGDSIRVYTTGNDDLSFFLAKGGKGNKQPMGLPLTVKENPEKFGDPAEIKRLKASLKSLKEDMMTLQLENRALKAKCEMLEAEVAELKTNKVVTNKPVFM